MTGTTILDSLGFHRLVLGLSTAVNAAPPVQIVPSRSAVGMYWVTASGARLPVAR
jgi:hypothetical protein